MAATATASATAPSSGPRYAPVDPTLPKPWRGLVDGSTGYLYFWNPETNVTQYERPVASSHASPHVPQKPSMTPISSSVQTQQSSQGQHNNSGSEEDLQYHGNAIGGSKLATSPRSRDHQISKGSSVYSHQVLNGPSAQAAKSSSRGHGSSDTGSGSSAESYRRQHEITVSGVNVPAPFTSFESSGFPAEILREVHNAGFSVPTPIQAQTWPIALQSRDIVAIAKTGSGKTLGYLVPGFVNLKRCRNNSQLGPTVLVLSPTRELATQILDEVVKFGRSSRISCTCLYGGAPKGPQLRDLERGADIVVATPGRLNDILEMKKVSLRQVSYLVLDEADRMLDMGFEPQIRKIVNEIPARRQTLMYTATWPKEVRKIAADLLVNPVQVNIGNINELVANKSITQYVEVVASMEKQRRLEQILRSQEPGSKCIVFCSTKKMCDQLARTIGRQFGAAAIHGDKSQIERDNVLNQFRSGRSPILVATDVAARGLDVKDIRVVINYDFPTGIEDYVHRIGRTGRAGATGMAYTFLGEQDAKHASDLVKILEGSNQRVPPEIRDMASRGGGMGRYRRQWGSSGSGGSDGGRGGYNDSGFGGRGSRGGPPSSGRSERGGRGHDRDLRDRNDRDYNDGNDVNAWGGYERSYPASSSDHCVRSRSRSPNRGYSGSVDRNDGAPPIWRHSIAVMKDSPHGQGSVYPDHSSSVHNRSLGGENSQSLSDGRENTRGSYDPAQQWVGSPHQGGGNVQPSPLRGEEDEEQDDMIAPNDDEEVVILEERDVGGWS
ncbi:ATP-dependent RNA helicase-like protein DB10 isoform X2 [Macadamia integrifolia]|uniref:ATP-dependent RNA helicase-like protein DB10 isoform X2 n=1 Tax=Macadamia integrifolia TaxID=60698 RepID=UPI001C4E9AC8|nr:ATP-dependent RNA helicase-like protein DB10 isoform X2 [Macadamia integrifolia]